MMEDSVQVFAALVSLASLKLVVAKFLAYGKPKNAINSGTVSGIYIYPVKSCAAIEVDAARATYSGLMDLETGVMDRHFMVVDGDTKNFISQRKEPSLSLVKPRIEGKSMTLEAPGMEPLSVPLKPENTSSDGVFICSVWGDPVPGLDCGKKAQEWFTTYLKYPAALMYAAPTLKKRLLFDSHLCRYYDNVVYQDWGQVLCVSDTALDELNQKLEDPVEMRNFRPNFTINGCPPHDEDLWQTFYIGKAQFTNIKLCGRCLMTTVDPKRGIKRNDGQPLKALKMYRTKPGFGSEVLFGVNVFCDVEGLFKKGDRIDVVRKEETNTWF